MGKVFATCGHELQSVSEGVAINVKEFTREGGRAISHGFYCRNCARALAYEGVLATTPQEEWEWLNGLADE